MLSLITVFGSSTTNFPTTYKLHQIQNVFDINLSARTSSFISTSNLVMIWLRGSPRVDSSMKKLFPKSRSETRCSNHKSMSTETAASSKRGHLIIYDSKFSDSRKHKIF